MALICGTMRTDQRRSVADANSTQPLRSACRFRACLLAGPINKQRAGYERMRMSNSTRHSLRDFYRQCDTQLAGLLDDTRFLQWDRGLRAV